MQTSSEEYRFSMKWRPRGRPLAECLPLNKHLLQSTNTSRTPTCQALFWEVDKTPSVQGDRFLANVAMQRAGGELHTFLPALLALHLTACGMATYHTHFTDGMAEAQRGEGMPLNHTVCHQRSWDLHHPPWILFTQPLPVCLKYMKLWAERADYIISFL